MNNFPVRISLIDRKTVTMLSRSTMSFVCFFLASAVLYTVSNSSPLYFTLMVSSAPGMNTSDIVPSLERALEDINSDSTILPGYSLRYTRVLDTRCNATRSLQLFDEELQFNQTVLAVVGCGCSSATELVTINSSVPIISYASTSIVLNDRSVYKNFFRTIPSDELIPEALATMMKYYGWRTLALATEGENQFTQLLSVTVNELQLINVTVENITTGLNSHDQDLRLHIDNFLNLDQHIRCLYNNPTQALSFLCEAYKLRHYYPNYLWIVPGWYSENWWMEFSDYFTTLNCTSREVEQVLNRSLTFTPIPGYSKSTNNVFNKTIINPSNYAADAVRALALAVNSSISKNDSTATIMNITDELRTVNFSGLTGRVEFSDGNRQSSIVLVEQYRSEDGLLQKVPIGLVDAENFIFLSNETNVSTWPEGIPPDGTPIKVTTKLLLPVMIVSIVLLSAGILLATIFFFFNLFFRNRPVVKLTSPNLNYLICLGAIVEVSSLVFFIVSTPAMENHLLFSFMCSTSYFLASIGHDISFSLALVKTFRVNFIFRNPSPVRKVIQDWKLFIATCVLVGIDLLFFVTLLVPGSILSLPLSLTEDLETPTQVNDKGIQVIPCSLRCGRNIFFIVWLGVTVLYKFVLHLIAIILACRVRRVELDAINDYKYNVAIIYISSFLISMLVVVLFVFNSLLNLQNTSATFISVIIFLECVTFIGITFFPKVVLLYKDPKGKHIFDKTSSGSRNASLTHSMKNQSMTQSMSVL